MSTENFPYMAFFVIICFNIKGSSINSLKLTRRKTCLKTNDKAELSELASLAKLMPLGEKLSLVRKANLAKLIPLGD